MISLGLVLRTMTVGVYTLTVDLENSRLGCATYCPIKGASESIWNVFILRMNDEMIID